MWMLGMEPGFSGSLSHISSSTDQFYNDPNNSFSLLSGTRPHRGPPIPSRLRLVPPGYGHRSSAADHSEAKALEASQNFYSSWASGYLVGELKVRHTAQPLLCLVEITGVCMLCFEPQY